MLSDNFKAMQINRFYTTEGINPEDTVSWEKRSCLIQNSDGSTVFEFKNAEMPASFSQLASDIAISKYFRKAGLHGNPLEGETSFKQVVSRIADTIGQFGLNNGYFGEGQSFEIVQNCNTFIQELTYMLIHQIGAFNSPVWFNCGLSQKYDIKGSGGSWAWDESVKEAVEISDSYKQPQCSACFIQSVDDNLMSIFDLVKAEAKLFKYGSGSGTNFSAIRGKQEKLSGGGTSSGLMSFLEVFDRAAGATKSGGVTRRAAKMVCLDIDHPEIMDFIQWKSKEEKKVKVLIAAGYPADFNGEAYHTIAGQNSNNSVRVSDEFMNCFNTNAPWVTKLRTSGKDGPEYNSKTLWHELAKSAWDCADPGLQYDTTINNMHTCVATGPIRASNPCSEYMFLDNTACNLASLNLTKFLDEDNVFDVEAYQHAIQIFFIAQEILVNYSSYPTKEIAENSHKFRPLGLGYANLGTMLMVMGIPYDSEGGRAWCAVLTSILTGKAYETSIQLARVKGPFDGYDDNRDQMLKVIKQHGYNVKALSIPNSRTRSEQLCALDNLQKTIWKDVYDLGTQYGFRNAQATVLAPTGTIGLLMDCDTTGIEPDFSLVKFKKLAGGGYYKIVNQSMERALKTLNYNEREIGAILEYVYENLTIEGAPFLEDKHLSIFDCANRCGDGKRFLSADAHIKMMAAAQKTLSGAISKTVNLPNEATVEDIEMIYYKAWQCGLKAIAVYRDGCKSSQPLSSTVVTDTSPGAGQPTVSSDTGPVTEPMSVAIDNVTTVATNQSIRKRLPSKRIGWTQEAKVGGHKIFLRTGEYSDGKLGEIFVDMHKEGASFRSVMNCFAMAISIGLQHGVPLETYVDQFTFTRFEPQGAVEGHQNIKFSTSIIDYIFRVLGAEYLQRYDLCHIQPTLDNNTVAIESNANTINPEKYSNAASHLKNLMGDAPLCDVCGHTTVRNGTCYRCLNCGNSMGCS